MAVTAALTATGNLFRPLKTIRCPDFIIFASTTVTYPCHLANLFFIKRAAFTASVSDRSIPQYQCRIYHISIIKAKSNRPVKGEEPVSK
ncbi:hypothetical protein CS542_02210 [Pedobacter sp. IW39]|nr:hypothetical protein CS542_02210 [Pedobacter sp. IW39]